MWFHKVCVCASGSEVPGGSFENSVGECESAASAGQRTGSPTVQELSSDNGKIKVMFLPPNTSVSQPMDNGVIESCKRLYRKKQMFECLVVIEEEDCEDTRGACTLENFKNYSLCNAVFNLLKHGSKFQLLLWLMPGKGCYMVVM